MFYTLNQCICTYLVPDLHGGKLEYLSQHFRITVSNGRVAINTHYVAGIIRADVGNSRERGLRLAKRFQDHMSDTIDGVGKLPECYRLPSVRWVSRPWDLESFPLRFSASFAVKNGGERSSAILYRSGKILDRHLKGSYRWEYECSAFGFKLICELEE